MTGTRAKAGGEIGINGEQYDGGQFLPSSPMTVKGQFKTSKKAKTARKQEIAPYKWEVAPADNLKSIYTYIILFAAMNDSGKLQSFGNLEAMEHYGRTEKEIIELSNKWNAGERWMEK